MLARPSLGPASSPGIGLGPGIGAIPLTVDVQSSPGATVQSKVIPIQTDGYFEAVTVNGAGRPRGELRVQVLLIRGTDVSQTVTLHSIWDGYPDPTAVQESVYIPVHAG